MKYYQRIKWKKSTKAKINVKNAIDISIVPTLF